jgi:hypothetical protein
MKRVERVDNDDSDGPGQLRRYGENVLVCLTELPAFEYYNRCWRDGVLIGEENEKDEFLVSVGTHQLRVHRDRIQYKDVTQRPTQEGQLVLVHQMNNSGYSWWEATVRKIHPPDGVHDYPRCTVEWMGKYNHPELQHVVLHSCIVARHYTPPEERPEKKIKKLV